ncbi:Phosphotransferase involved in threonylcarbamoyladenosine t(6)A37 formation in tRNA [hydrothermal vent metagenome]|uniref:Phosphotransferase involved in threonylcarbamoyladenosine t(6)A37 formation in tRNA n=1 Tax=hydrothermal vent metagenome TaxID=652676 RepID=A0A3B1B185_9ZZZZ
MSGYLLPERGRACFDVRCPEFWNLKFMPQRLALLKTWLADVLETTAFTLAPASSDASFRRYFRLRYDGRSLIVMDAPPTQEDTAAFLRIAELLNTEGLNAPRILAKDIRQGFLLLTDLGDTPYLQVLTETTADRLYGDALSALLHMQQIHRNRLDAIPPYDRVLLIQEMNLFRDWYLKRQRQRVVSPLQEQSLDEVFERLASSALDQPVVFVHRDYHSRNLMFTEETNPGIIDFQDAVQGPVTYDLVSLLRDCYIRWPRARVEGWALNYLRDARQAGIVGMAGDAIDDEAWLRWFDWMGVQRHLKAAGIFARLNLRDGKPGYLGDIPRTLGYVREVAGRYRELQALLDFLPAGEPIL